VFFGTANNRTYFSARSFLIEIVVEFEYDQKNVLYVALTASVNFGTIFLRALGLAPRGHSSQLLHG